MIKNNAKRCKITKKLTKYDKKTCAKWFAQVFEEKK